MDYQKVYNTLISHRKLNPLKKSKELYTELHHILPRCLGGSDSKSNLVRLTAREHFIAHRLLTKIHTENSDLALALLFMLKVQGGHVSSSREISRLKELTAKVASGISTTLWKDPSYRRKVLESKKKFFESLGDGVWSNRQKLVMNANPETKEKLSEASKKWFGEPSNRLTMSRKKKENWKDETLARNTLEGQKRFLEENPWPWQRSRAQPTRHLWTLAATLWELRNGTKSSKTRNEYSAIRFSDEFCNGKNPGVFHKMIRLFKEGWIPQECPEYIEEFGDKM